MTHDEVFFDPRKKAEQEEKDLKVTQDMSKEEEEKLANIATGGMVVGAITRLFVAPAVLMLVWNMAMPTIGIATIGYWTAMGFYIIANILFRHYD